MQDKKVRVSVLIVYFSGKQELEKTLESVISNSTKSDEVIVINNSKNNIGLENKRKFSKIRFIISGKNLGYGGGNNLGAANAKGKYLFILNPDTRLFKNTISNLIQLYKQKKNAAIVAPNLLKPNGELFSQMGSSRLTPIKGIVAFSFLNKIFPNNQISKNYWLTDISLKKVRKVFAVPGSAFLIKRKVFLSVGGYDENMFLYFEESDLGMRIEKLGGDVYINPSAQVVHTWKFARKDGDELQSHFNRSRFYYFKKHFGIMNAILVEIFARSSKTAAVLLFALAVGIFLRFYKLEENLVFHGELGHNYLAIKDFLTSGTLPLLGPPTSHSWLHFGPLYYWLVAPFLLAFNFSPVSVAYFFAILGVLLIYVNYYVVKKLLNENIALISSLLISISPELNALTRGSRFFSLVVILFYPFFLFLLKSLDNPKYLFWSALFFGVMLNFHLTPIILLPFIFVFLFTNRDKYKAKDLLKAFLWFLIPNLPFLLHSSVNKFEMLFKFFAWLPYRSITTDSRSISSGVFSLVKFLNSIVYRSESLLLFFVLLTLLVVGIVKKKNKTILALAGIFLSGYIGILIHGDPPTHYYLPLFPAAIVLVSSGLSFLFKYKKIFIVFALLMTLNFSYFFSEKWFYRYKNSGELLVPYAQQLGIVEFILNDTGGKPFSLARKGYSDEFEGEYAQNYFYLFWLKGHEPVANGEQVFTIFERDHYPLEGELIYNEGDVKITKTKK